MVEIGQRVRVRCECTLVDGTPVDLGVDDDGVMEFVLGDQSVLHAISHAVCDMEVGEHRKMHVPSDEAFGAYDEGLIERVALCDLQGGERLPIGGYVEFSHPFGNIRVKVLRIEDGTVLFDHNHELAGQDLDLAMELLSIYGMDGSPLENELARDAGCGCGCDRLEHQLKHLHEDDACRKAC